MKIIYEADDGWQFNSKEECEDHEIIYTNILMFGADGEKIFDFDECVVFCCKTNEAAETLRRRNKHSWMPWLFGEKALAGIYYKNYDTDGSIYWALADVDILKRLIKFYDGAERF